jgi:transposase
MSKKPKQHYEDKFKEQIVMLCKKSEKSCRQISKEYNVPAFTINGWVKLYEKCGSFKLSDSRSESEKELIKLQKENKQLRMEVDILKYAALIMSQK